MSDVFLQTITSFDFGKQTSSITKNEAPLVKMLMLSTSTTITFIMLLSYEFTFMYRKVTLSVAYAHFKSFLPSLVNLVRLLRDVSRYAQVCLKCKIELVILKGICLKNDYP